jgi:uncharacterized protein (DUF736 family)
VSGDKEGEQYTDDEIARRRDEVLRRMANTSPKPRKKMKVGKTTVNQLWSHFSDEGEEWVLIRLEAPRNTRISRSPLLHRSCQLLAAANVAVAQKRPRLLLKRAWRR